MKDCFLGKMLIAFDFSGMHFTEVRVILLLLKTNYLDNLSVKEYMGAWKLER